MNTNLVVRPALPTDAATIVEFNRELARETEGVILDSVIVARGVAAGLADPERAIYLVAERDGELVGQIMLTKEWSDWRNGFIWWLQSVFVRADARQQGVVRHLIEAARQLAQSQGGVCLRLYVDEHNTTAQAVYRRLGLAPAGYFVYEGSCTEPSS